MNRLYVSSDRNLTLTPSEEPDGKLASLLCRYQHFYAAGSYLDCNHISAEIKREMADLAAYDKSSLLRNIGNFLSATVYPCHRKLLSAGDFTAYFQTINNSLLTRSQSEDLDIDHVLTYIRGHYA